MKEKLLAFIKKENKAVLFVLACLLAGIGVGYDMVILRYLAFGLAIVAVCKTLKDANLEGGDDSY